MAFEVTFRSDDGRGIPCMGIAAPSDPKLRELFGGQPASSDLQGRIAFRYGSSPQADQALDIGGAYLLLRPRIDGYWTARHEKVKGGAQVTASGLPHKPWWNDLLVPTGPDPSRGSGIRIGIVDTPWESDHGLEHIARSDCNGDVSPLMTPSHGCWAHGEMVTRLVAGPTGIAPASNYLFIAVSDGDVGEIDFAEVISAIELLASGGVDLINLSLGKEELESTSLEQLRDAVQEATSLGSLCVVAAGNSPGDGLQVFVPARFDECVGVGAVGRRGVAPRETLSGYLEEVAIMWGSSTPSSAGTASMVAADMFVSPHCATGKGLDLMAPGVGVYASRYGKSSHELSGTSFAAPLAVGVLASLLAGDSAYQSMPRDRHRAEYAKAVLNRACYGIGLAPAWQGAGIPRVDKLAVP